MRWPLAILLGFINALFTALASGFAAEWGTRWHKVSNMEGGRGMLIAFIFVPLGFIVGLIVGLWIARSKETATFAAGLGRLGFSMGVSLVLVACVLGLAWASADHPPTIDGRPLVLEYEMRLPPGYPVRERLKENEFRAAVVVSSSDRNYSEVDFDHVRKDGDWVVVPVRADMNSMGTRTVSATYGPFEPYPSNSQFGDIPLAPKPTKADFEWSKWYQLTRRFKIDEEVPAAERVQVRYRVRFADADSTP
jgi:MFS family permease